MSMPLRYLAAIVGYAIVWPPVKHLHSSGDWIIPALINRACNGGYVHLGLMGCDPLPSRMCTDQC